MDNLKLLRDLNEQIDAATRTEFGPGVYKHAIDRRFPMGAKRGFLPIIAEDYIHNGYHVHHCCASRRSKLKKKLE